MMAMINIPGGERYALYQGRRPSLARCNSVRNQLPRIMLATRTHIQPNSCVISGIVELDLFYQQGHSQGRMFIVLPWPELGNNACFFKFFFKQGLVYSNAAGFCG